MCNVQKRIDPQDMPPIWEGTSCHYSDAYRFIFVKNCKTAGSTIGPGFLRPRICPVKPNEKGVVVYFEAPFSESCTDYKYMPRNDPHYNPDYYPCSMIPRSKWRSYYVFTSVRDPVDRAASTYTYCRKSELGVSVKQFCQNPNSGGALCQITTRSDEDVEDLHWASQTDAFCNPRTKNCIVDYIVRVESLEEDMDKVIWSINQGRDPDYPELPLYSKLNVTLNSQHRGSMGKSDETVDKVLVELESTLECKEGLLKWYGYDFDMLGYARPGEIVR